MKNIEILLVLVPHKDARAQLLKYSESLYKNVLNNVYPFPCVIPIASVTEPLSPDELKQAAYFLRKSIGKEKIIFSGFTFTSFNICGNEMLLFGQRLEPEIKFDVSGIKTKKIKSCFMPLISGVCFAAKNNEDKIRASAAQEKEGSCAPLCSAANSIPLINGQKIFFRAAATANMIWKPCAAKSNEKKEIYYKWEIGKLSWLPKEIKKNKNF